MLLRAFLLFFLATSAYAQSVDLTKLPDDFSFTSQGENGVTVVTYLGQDGALFKFDFTRDASEGDPSQEIAWLDRNSRTVRFTGDNETESYQPHDCAPQNGVCDFTAKVSTDEKYSLTRTTYLVGDVWVDRLYLIIDGERIFYSQGCTTYDEFGFWINSFAENFEGKRYYGKRISSSAPLRHGTSFEELENMCLDAEELTS